MNVSCVVLSRDEECNIGDCIRSLKLVSKDIWVVDSGSTDRTCEIARELGANVVHKDWMGFSKQWNFALQELPLLHDYVMLQASDEQITDEWANEFKTIVESDSPPDLIQTRFDFWWLDRPILHGGYGKTWIVKAGRRELMKYNGREVNEHIPLTGFVYKMKNKYLHQDKKEVQRWFQKHLKYAELEAMERVKASESDGVKGKLFGGGQALRKLWLRQNVYDNIPPILRPFVFFFFRYFLQLGFLDGYRGFYFHFMHALWYPLLIDLYHLNESIESKRLDKSEMNAS